MWWNAGFHVKRRVAEEREMAWEVEHGKPMSARGEDGRRTSSSWRRKQIEKGADMAPSTLLAFKAALKHRFGSITRAWRVVMDVDGNGRLSFREFCHALREVGYVGDFKTLWYQLDEDLSGEITLHELDPENAMLLERFRTACFSRYGSMHRAWKMCLDRDASGIIQPEEFADACKEMGMTDDPREAEALFDLLDLDRARGISEDEVDFLSKWEEEKRDAAFKKRLGVAWVNKDPYFHVNTNAARTGTPGTGTTQSFPKAMGGSGPKALFGNSVTALRFERGTLADLSLAQRPQTVGTVGTGGTAGLTETDWTKAAGADPKKQWENFQKFLKKKYGSLCKAFSAMDANESGSLSCVEFQSVVCGVLRYCRASDAKRLFYAVLDKESQAESFQQKNDEGRGLITWKEFGITPQEWLHYSHERRQQNERRALRFVEKSRHQRAVEKHISYKKDKTPRTDLAFGMPLPKGWAVPGTPEFGISEYMD